jgi:hypothetical protein
MALALVSTALAPAAPAAAADAAGFAPQYGGDQFMLYVSRAVGARRSSPSTFGIRFERATLVSSDPTAQCCVPLRHHALVELQLTRGAAARVQFGNRVTWDLGRRQLAPTAMFTRLWQLPNQTLTSSVLAAWTP